MTITAHQLPPATAGPVDGILAIGVCIVNFHSAAMVRRLVESLCSAQGSARLVISCVDNSQSGPELVELAELQRTTEERGVRFLLWQSPVNSGYAAGNNAASPTINADLSSIMASSSGCYCPGTGMPMDLYTFTICCFSFRLGACFGSTANALL